MKRVRIILSSGEKCQGDVYVRHFAVTCGLAENEKKANSNMSEILSIMKTIAKNK